MNKTQTIKKLSDEVMETEMFADIINAIVEKVGMPFAFTVSETGVTAKGDQKNQNLDKLNTIYFKDYGYPNLSIQSEIDGIYVNEIQIFALAIYEYYKQEQKKSNLYFSYTYPQSKDYLGLPSKNGSEWTVFFRKENVDKEKRWQTYAILALYFGWIGVHNFYAGQKKKGMIKIAFDLTIVGMIISVLWSFYEAWEAFFQKKIPE